MTNRLIDIQTGEVAVATEGSVLISNGIGSCVAVVILDTKLKTGGIAHIMLPGKSPRTHSYPNTRYANNAISDLLSKMTAVGSQKHDMKAFFAGGGNVLQKTDDTLCDANIKSVRNLLNQHKIPIIAEQTGGTKRRKVTLDLKSFTILCAEGNEGEKVVFKAGK